MQPDNNLTIKHCWLTDIDEKLYPAKLVVIGISFLIAATILLGWNSPAFSALLPNNWFLMQATTALSIMFIAYGLLLKVSWRAYHTRHIQKLFATLSIVVTTTSLYQHLTGDILNFGHYLVATSHQSMVHPTSLQSATCLLLISILLFINEKETGVLGYIFCTVLFLLTTLLLTFFSSYLFNALNLISANNMIIISKQTLVCIVLLTFVMILIRAPYGVYKVLFSTSLGGRFSRQLLFVTVAMVFIVMSLELILLDADQYNVATVNTIIMTVDIILLYFVIIIAGNKIENQSDQLTELTITDKLTGVYNLRGLNLYAAHKLKYVRRNKGALSILLFDIDDLKNVNDKLGHEIGSELIQSFAAALKSTFRSIDIVARIGGDEFVVIALEDAQGVEAALKRLAQVIDEINNFSKHPYKIHYSVGSTELKLDAMQTLDDLIEIADAKMYAEKRKKKALKT